MQARRLRGSPSFSHEFACSLTSNYASIGPVGKDAIRKYEQAKSVWMNTGAPVPNPYQPR